MHDLFHLNCLLQEPVSSHLFHLLWTDHAILICICTIIRIQITGETGVWLRESNYRIPYSPWTAFGLENRMSIHQQVKHVRCDYLLQEAIIGVTITHTRGHLKLSNVWGENFKNDMKNTSRAKGKLHKIVTS